MKTTPRFWLATLFAMLPLTAFADWNEISSFDDGMRVFVNTGTVERIDEIAVVSHLGEEFAEHAQLAFFMRIGGLEQDLPEAVNTVLFRITQEALTNIDKHAGAGRVDLRLIYRGGDVRLTVSDDGHGFDTAAIRADPRRGIGLLNMRERIESIGGEFRVQSRPGATRVVAQIGADAIRRLTPPPVPPAPSAVSAASLPSPTDVRRPDANPDRR